MFDTEWRHYRRLLTTVEMIRYRKGIDMSLVSISEADIKAGSPKFGDMIARNPRDPSDQWLINAEYFYKNYDPNPLESPYA